MNLKESLTVVKQKNPMVEEVVGSSDGSNIQYFFMFQASGVEST